MSDQNKMYYHIKYDSPLGWLTVASDGAAIVGLWLDGQKYYCEGVDLPMADGADVVVLGEARLWLDRYFRGEEPSIKSLKLRPIGSAFRQAVWRVLCEIPYGSCITYGDIAKRIAAETGRETMSAQAVGGAVGHNPISIIIPCHRVVGAGGKLTGYAGGLDKKEWLLRHEGAIE